MGEAADCFAEFVGVGDRVVEGGHRWLLDRWVLIDEVRVLLRRVAASSCARLDLPCGGGRSDGAVPELQHHDALGDLPRALRRLRLHPAVLRRRALQLIQAPRYRGRK